MTMDRAVRVIAAAAFGYEAAALAGAPVPSLTVICSRYRWLIPAVIAAAAVHLWRASSPVPAPVPG